MEASSFLTAVRAKGNEYLPVLEYLVQTEVCIFCALRFIGIREHVYSQPSPNLETILLQIHSSFGANGTCESKPFTPETRENGQHDSEVGGENTVDKNIVKAVETIPCIVCFGILQNATKCFERGSVNGVYEGIQSSEGEKEEKGEEGVGEESRLDKEEKDIDSKSARNGTVWEICDAIKKEGHVVTDFCLEVSISPLVILREYSIWYHLRNKFPSIDIFQHRLSEHNSPLVPLKEAFKWALTGFLENALRAKFDPKSEFRVSLVFSHLLSSSEVAKLGPLQGTSAKRKRQDRYGDQRGGGKEKFESPNNDFEEFENRVERGKSPSELTMEERESLSSLQKSLTSISVEEFEKRYPWPLKKLADFCGLRVLSWRNPVYVGGRYLKYSRSLSQSRWVVGSERVGVSSVEEELASAVVPGFQADGHKFQAAGREDIDVRMLGNGRPFLLEILNARVLPPPNLIQEMERKINSSKNKWVAVRRLQRVGGEAAEIMREGEADKQKEYCALVWVSRPITEEDKQMLEGKKNMSISQKTPIRVLHRRSALTRPRIIHRMACEEISGNPNFFVLRLTTQAGTYVKEFVHGDFGRTQPNLASLLGRDVDILQLDVTDIKMDFL